MEMGKDMEALLYSYLRGTVSDEEILEAERWINASPGNRKIAEQLCVIDFANEAMQCMHNANPVRSLEKVKVKIRKNKIRLVVVWTQRVAAVLFIPLLCIKVYEMLQPNVTEETIRIQPQTVEISSAPGMVTNVYLPDGTKVWLNANSKIQYPTFFDGDTREVSVTGELYFVVAKDIEKPFLVNVNDAFKIKVTGTEFNVDAYQSAASFAITLIDGSIDLISAIDPTKSLLTLKPGEQSVWDVKEKTVNVMNVNTMMLSSWKEGKIIFRDTPITEIAATLGKRYNTRFVISPRLTDYHFTGTFINVQLVQILEHFKISSNIRYEIKGLDLNPDGTINNTIVELK